jgi:hypothetical protein
MELRRNGIFNNAQVEVVFSHKNTDGWPVSILLNAIQDVYVGQKANTRVVAQELTLDMV